MATERYFHLDDTQKLNWLRLFRSQSVGPVTFRQLISHYGSAATAIEDLPELAKRGGAAARIRIFPVEDAEKEILKCEQIGAQFVALGEPDFPPLLRASEQSPPILCVRGSTSVLTRNAVAIVGSRNASVSGMRLTRRFAAQLGEAGYVVASGLARGIDAAAHAASVQTGTIAVFAGGVDTIFPDENRELAREILDHDGAFISEMPIGWKPRAKDFPRRNRIVTGLANSVVVVEAAKRSGSLISARLASEMGRLVLAVPGSPLDPRSEGTNDLIRKGATLVASTEDILEAIAPLDLTAHKHDADMQETDNLFINDENQPAKETDEQTREKIIAAISPSPTEVDDIIRFTGAATGEVQLVLMELAIAGRLERHAGNRVSLV